MTGSDELTRDPAKIATRLLGRAAPYLLPLLVCALPLGMLWFHLSWIVLAPALVSGDGALHSKNAQIVALAAEDDPAVLPALAVGTVPDVLRPTVRPPLIYIASALSDSVYPEGFGADGLIYPLVFFSLVLSLSVFYAVRRLTGGGTVGGLFGLFAACCVTMLPLVFETAHRFSPDLPLTAIVALCMALFLASDDLSRRSWALAFAFASGLAMLTGWPAAVFLAGPVLVPLLVSSNPNATQSRGRYAAWLGVVLAIALCVCAPFYLRSGVLELAGGPGVGSGWGLRAPAEGAAARAPFFAALFYYPAVFFVRQAGGLPGSLMAIGVLLALIHATRARWPLLAGAVLPVVFFTLVSPKWPERTLPMLPLVVMLAFSGFSAIRGRRAAGLAVAFICALTPFATEPGGTMREIRELRVQEATSVSEPAEPVPTPESAPPEIPAP